jgi:autotransporter-associated beta strand protein
MLLAPASQAASGTWLGLSGNWGDSGTWNGGILAEGADFTANFTGINITTNQTITIEAPRTIGNITFTDATTSSHNLTLSGANTLTLDVTTGNPVIDVTQSGRSLTISSVIGGSDGLRKNGAGTLVLSGPNTYTGGTTIAAGVVTLSNATSLGSGTVSITGGGRINTVGGITYANPLNVGAALSLQYTGANNGTASFSGVLSGSSAITVVTSGLGGSNAGTLAFNNTGNTFTGNVIMPSNTGGSDVFRFASIGDGGNFTFARPSWREAVVYNGTANITFNTRQIAIASTVGTASGLDGNGNPVNMFQNNGSGRVIFNTDMVMPASIATSTYFTFGGSNTGTNTFAGLIAAPGGTNTLGIVKWDAGKWILSNTNNSFTGHAWIAAGTLSVPAIASLWEKVR